MRAVLITLATTGGLQLINLIGSVLAARLLLPEGRGELAAAMLWPTTIAYLVVIGLNDAVTYHAAAGRIGIRRVFAVGLWFGIGLSILGAVLTWVAVLPYAYGEMRADVVWVATLLLAIIPCHILGMVFQELLRGQMRLGAWNALRISLGALYVLIAGGGWLLFGIANVESFAVAWLVAHIVPTVIALWLCLAAGYGGWRFDARDVAAMLPYGLKIHASNVIGMLNGRVDQMLVQLYLTPAALGLYVVAVNLAQLTATLANSVTLVAFPRAAGVAAADRPATIGLYLRLTLALMLASTGALAVITPYALSLLWGPAFADATDVVRVLLLGVIPLAMRDFAVMAFKVYDRALEVTKAELASLLVNAALLVALVPSHGLMGAAIAYVISRWCAALILGWLVKRELGLALLPLLRPVASDVALLRDGLARLSRRTR